MFILIITELERARALSVTLHEICYDYFPQFVTYLAPMLPFIFSPHPHTDTPLQWASYQEFPCLSRRGGNVRVGPGHGFDPRTAFPEGRANEFSRVFVLPPLAYITSTYGIVPSA